MTNDDVAAAIRHFKTLPMPPGVLPRVRRITMGGQLAVQVDLWCGGQSAEPIKLTHAYDPSVGLYVAREAKKLADASCDGSGNVVPPIAPPMAGDDEDHRPKWLKAASVKIASACDGKPHWQKARLVALTLIGDIEADDLPIPDVSLRPNSLALAWHSEGESLEVACHVDGTKYVVRPIGFAARPVPFTVEVSERTDQRGNLVTCVRPELLRWWVWMLYCDSAKGFGVDGDTALAETGWWTDDEIEALDDSPFGKKEAA